MRDPGFRWDGTSFLEQSDHSIAVARIATYAPALKAIISTANTGFPAHGDLESTFKILQRDHKIFEDYSNKVLADATSAWRTMCKNLYDFRKGCVVDVPAAVQELVDMIVLPSGGSSMAELPQPAPAEPPKHHTQLTLEQVTSLFPQSVDSDEDEHDAVAARTSGDNEYQIPNAQSEDDDCKMCYTESGDDDCKIVSIMCNCKLCPPAAEIRSQPAPDIPIPRPDRGGQRKETVGENGKNQKKGSEQIKTRFRQKTTPHQKLKSKAGQDTELQGPCKLVIRVKDEAGYILDANKTYICQCSERMHGEMYMMALKALVKEIDQKKIKRKSAAKEFVGRFLG